MNQQLHRLEPETGKRGMAGLILIVAVIVVFDLAALRWGADSRPAGSDRPIRNI